MTRNFRTLTVLTLLLLAVLVLAGCGGRQQPTATPVPTAAPTLPSPPADVWAKAQQTGKLLVGTSADYPPYEYYNEQFKLDGFDIALMKAIGQKLGVDIEFNDFAFDGLPGALQIGQIDAAIAAITVTEERQQVMDFSSIYHVGSDAVLVNENWQQGQITSPSELSTVRIGVQGGSVYETYVQRLIDQGTLPASNMLVYTDVGQAIRDLKAGRIDAVMLGLAPAEEFVKQGGVKIAIQGMNEQNLAIAMPKGQDALRRVINQALADLQNEGVIDQLRKEYLGIEPDEQQPVPTSTPEPATPTPVPNQPTLVPTIAPPPPGCIDGMAWVADLSYDDKNMTAPPLVQPGQPFVKSWRVRNVGTCTWNSGYFLGYVGGNVPAAQMGGQPVYVQGQVAPGQTYDFSVNLVAPAVPGVYQGFWQMTNDNGQKFGETIWVGIRVPAPATATPAPTQTPVAGIFFTVNATNIQQGQCVTFQWNVTGVQAVYFYSQGQNWQDHGVGGQGSQQECPQQTTTYYLRVVMNNGSVETRQITVTVQPVANAPLIQQFTVNPQGQIQAGQCVQLQWNVTGNVNRVAVVRNGTPLWDYAPVVGNMQDCPPGTGQMGYVLQAFGPGGQSQAVQYVTVVAAPATATPAPPTNTPVAPTNTPQPPTSTPVPQPSISGFTVQPVQINPGECVTVAWTTVNSARVQVTRDGAVILDNGPIVGQVQDCPGNAGTVTYGLTAINSIGATVSQQTAIVVQAQPTNTPPPQPITGNWSVSSLNGATVIPGTQLTANFDGNGQLSGSGGCNTYNASYSTSGNNLSISGLAHTQMACPSDDIAQQENTFFQLLPQAAMYLASGPTLRLYDGSNALIMELSMAR